MQFTSYCTVNLVLETILQQLQLVLGEKLVGVYLYGSAVWGDFDPNVSDLDLLAALTSDIEDFEVERLRIMHTNIAHMYPQWDDRVEVQYFSVQGLRTFKAHPRKMGVISPGEPLHVVMAGKEWLTNWYFVQEYGLTLLGPAPKTIVPFISKEEFIAAVRSYALEWREYVKNTRYSRPSQAYAILTMCRALYTLKHREQVSKPKAAEWAKSQLPEYACLINLALRWREEYRNAEVVHEKTYPVTVEFVHHVIEQIQNENL